MTMDTILPTLACYLLAISFAVAQTENGNSTITTTITTSDLNLTHTTAPVTPSYSTVHESVTNLTDNTTPLTSTTQNSDTFTTTAATTESKSPVQTSQSTTMTPLTDSTSLTSTTAGAHTPTFTAMTTPAMQTTGGYISTPDTTVITTANSSHTVNTTSVSPDGTTQASRLNSSEKNMTIIFSAVLGMFAVALVGIMLYKCKHKIQYLHRPLTADDTDAFVADDDTLVISGGLYDGHPIYDNVPTPSEDQSQFRLEFLH